MSRTRLVSAFSLLILVAIGAGPSRAQGVKIINPKPSVLNINPSTQRQAFCRSYAGVAVKQYNLNQQRKCRYGGWDWHGNFNKHYSWCLGADPNVVRRKQMWRASELSRCATRNLKPGKCANYANSSVAQQMINQQKGCKYRGIGWHRNYKVHYNWCMGVSLATSAKHLNDRQAALKRCQQGSPQCDGYARTAVAQYKEAKRRGCRVGGWDWHENYATHYRWCVGKSAGVLNAKSNMRAKKLQTCGKVGGVTKTRFCQAYAQNAVKQNALNHKYKCGYVGFGWHSNYRTHNNWCLGTDPKVVNRHTLSRNQAIKRCQAKKVLKRSKEQHCKSYTQKSIAQQRENQRRRCGFWGVAWHTNYRIHYDWCMRSYIATADKELANRENQLRKCRRK